MTIKKSIENLESKFDILDKTVKGQEKMIEMLSSLISNQKMTLEMLVSLSKPHENSILQKKEETNSISNGENDDVVSNTGNVNNNKRNDKGNEFPINRRTIV